MNHAVALQEKNRVICTCGKVCDAKIGQSPARIIGTTTDYYVAVAASTVFARHLRAEVDREATTHTTDNGGGDDA